jgi:nicotinamide-nucleotide amidase
MSNCHELAAQVVSTLSGKGQKLAVVESCTGGQFAAAVTAIPGASAIFVGGLVAYTNAVKAQVLGVDWTTLDKHGAVSEECARELAGNASLLFRGDNTVAITGIAGPSGGTDEKPVGTVYIALCHPAGMDVERLSFSGDRAAVQAQAVEHALRMVLGKVV